MTLLDEIMSWLGPKEAEAKIRGTPDAMDLVSDVWGQAEKQRSGDYLSDIYSQIFRAADAHPATVNIEPQPGLRYGGSAGRYSTSWIDPYNEIRYDPSYPQEDMGNILGHELTHFLAQQSQPYVETPGQHSLIKMLLGTDKYKPASQLQGYKPPTITQQDRDIINRWLGRR